VASMAKIPRAITRVRPCRSPHWPQKPDVRALKAPVRVMMTGTGIGRISQPIYMTKQLSLPVWRRAAPCCTAGSTRHEAASEGEVGLWT
jgi:hypothetical protein